mgnify:CR=1 FL=1
MLARHGPFVYKSETEEREFNFGPREQRQIARLPNGSVYLGEWTFEGNIKEGKGVQVWPDGSLYEGYWSANKANYFGRLLHKDGDIYQG